MPFSPKRHFFAYSKPGVKTGGFSLIEIVLSMFVILALVSILFTVSATYSTSRKSSLQGIAAEIATRRVEVLRNTAYAAIAYESDITFTDPSTSKLPNSTAKETISQYQSSADVKQVAISITWTESGNQRTFNMDTLIYKNGI